MADGALAMADYWRPTRWQEAGAVPESDPQTILHGWPPKTHGDDDRGFAVQARDLEIMARVWAAGCLLTDHVRALFWPGANGPRAVRGRMLKLYDAGLVRQYRPQLARSQGAASFMFSLTRLGLAVLQEARLPWFEARYPEAEWDDRQHDRPPSLDAVHGLVAADIACWACARLNREWVHESEPACRIQVRSGGKGSKGDVFIPDAILEDRAGLAPAWYLEVERAAYGPTWRAKAAKWAT